MRVGLGDLEFSTRIRGPDAPVKSEPVSGSESFKIDTTVLTVVLPDVARLRLSSGKKTKQTYDKNELLDMCTTLGLSKSGTKAALIDRIINEVHRREA